MVYIAIKGGRGTPIYTAIVRAIPGGLSVEAPSVDVPGTGASPHQPCLHICLEREQAPRSRPPSSVRGRRSRVKGLGLTLNPNPNPNANPNPFTGFCLRLQSLLRLCFVGKRTMPSLFAFARRVHAFDNQSRVCG